MRSWGIGRRGGEVEGWFVWVGEVMGEGGDTHVIGLSCEDGVYCTYIWLDKGEGSCVCGGEGGSRIILMSLCMDGIRPRAVVHELGMSFVYDD